MYDVARWRRVAEGKLADYRHAKRSVSEWKVALAVARRRVRDTAKAQKLIQTAAAEFQRTAHARISGLVSRALKAVFPNPYEFDIVFEKKRGRTEARMVFRRDGEEMDPGDGVGGSVLDVAGLALRLTCLSIQRPPRRRLLVLDEPFGGLSSRQGNKRRFRQLLETLAEELSFQIIMVTHDRGLRAGKVVEI